MLVLEVRMEPLGVIHLVAMLASTGTTPQDRNVVVDKGFVSVGIVTWLKCENIITSVKNL